MDFCDNFSASYVSLGGYRGLSCPFPSSWTSFCTFSNSLVDIYNINYNIQYSPFLSFIVGLLNKHLQKN